MKRCVAKTCLTAIVAAAVTGVWMTNFALAGRGGGGHPGGGNFGGGAGGFRPGGGNFSGGAGGFHPGGNLGAGGGGIQHSGNSGFNGGNFNQNTFNRPTQGHVPSFSLPGQGNFGGQTFQHMGNNNFPNKNISGQTQHNLPNNNFIPGQTLNPAIHNIPSGNFIPGQTLNPNINRLPSNNNFIPGQTPNRPNLGNRPTNIGNHTNFINNNNNFIHGGNTNHVVVNKPVIGGNTNFNQQFNNQNFNNRNFNNFNNNFARQNGWYHGHWHNNWNNAWYNRPVTWWGGGYGLGYGLGFGGLGYGFGGYGLASIPWTWGYYNYFNPYNVAPVGNYVGYDYSQPIVVAQAPANQVVNDPNAVPANDPNQPPSANDLASQSLGAARESFLRGDYTTALAQTDQAIAQLPNDPVLHEFRGLVLFALRRYQEAAAAVYGVLSVGPGWDWTTLISLYPDGDTYTGQLRTLEQYINENPRQPEARFLLAYHYLICGHTQDATAELKAAVQLNPKDQLSAQLLSSLTAPQNAGQPDAHPGVQPAPAQPMPEAQAIDPASLIGDWKATRPDGSTFALSLANDNTFTWKFSQQGKTQSFSGPYTIENNALILKQGENPAMAGVVTPLSANSFNFKVGDNPADPGLTFSR